jgi:uncharacterized protein
MKDKLYDVVIIGKGPAGTGAALRLSEVGLDVLIADSGSTHVENLCSRFVNQTTNPELREPSCKVQYCLAGTGGAALHFEANLDNCPDYLDDKLSGLSSSLKSAFGSECRALEYVNKAYELLRQLGLVVPKGTASEIEEKKSSLSLRSSGTIPVNLEQVKLISDNIEESLKDRDVTFLDSHTLQRVEGPPGSYSLTFQKNSRRFDLLSEERVVRSKYVVLCLGKRSYSLISKLSEDLKFHLKYPSHLELGFRVELDKSWMDQLVDADRNPRLSVETNYGVARSFCICHGGRMMQYSMGREKDDLIIDGQHAHTIKGSKTNFAILCRKESGPKLTSLDYASRFVNDVNNLTSSLPVQLIRDLLRGRSSNHREFEESRPSLQGLIPADLSQVVQSYELGVVDFLSALQHHVGFELPARTIITGPAVEKYNPRIVLNRNFESTVRGVYFAGDCTGIVSGIVSGLATGIKVGESIEESYE